MRASVPSACLLWFLILAATSPTHAQLTLIEGPNVRSEAPVYLDAEGERHTRLVKVKFNEEVVVLPRGADAFTLNDIGTEYGAVRGMLLALGTTYGSFTMLKRYPDVMWGETSVVDPRTGQQVVIADLSQWVELWFDAPVPLEDVATALKAAPEVAFVDAPYVYHLDAEPSDSLYTEQWNLMQISAAEAWNLARGFVGDTPPIVIGLSDDFSGADIDTDGVEAAVHPDLRYDPLLGGLRLDNSGIGNAYGGHGTAVAGHAGALTDNGALGEPGGSVASLSWTVALKGYEQTPAAIRAATCTLPGLAPCFPVDVLNMSWSVYDCSGFPDGATPGAEDIDCEELEEALDNALGTATVLTGSTGNANQGPNPSNSCRPCQPIPGGYYSSQHGRGVLTVNATREDLSVQQGWNYADPDANPLTEPALAYMDLAAPGLGVIVLRTFAPNQHGYSIESGTSFSAPTAAALVALLLSVNENLTHDQITEALVRTADEVVASYPLSGHTPYSTPGVYGEMWDPYYGYGQINAYQAVRYVIEHFGGRIGGTTDAYPYVLAEPLTLHAGAALTVRAGTELEVTGDLHVEAGAALTLETGATLRFTSGTRLLVEGSLGAEGATLTEAEAGQGWDGILVFDTGRLDLDGATVAHADIGVAVYSTDVTIAGSDIEDNRVGVESGFVADYCATYPNCPTPPTPGRSAFTLEQALSGDSTRVRNNAEAGVRALNTNAEIRFTNISGNGTSTANTHVGLGVSNATVFPFERNVIEGSGSFGVAVIAGGDIDMRPLVSGFGENRVAGNGTAEVFVYNGGTAFLGSSTSNGRNSVYDTGGLLLRNLTSATVQAKNTYWDTLDPAAAGAFAGPVAFTPVLPCDYTVVPEVCVFARGAAGATVYARDGIELDPVADGEGALGETIRAVRAALAAAPTSEAAPTLVYELGALHRRDRGDALGEWAATAMLLGALRATLAAPELSAAERATAEAALEVETVAALVREDYEAAGELVAAWGPRAQSEAVGKVLGLVEGHLAAREGRYAEASALVEAVAAAETDPAVQTELRAVAAAYARRAREGSRGAVVADVSRTASVTGTPSEATLAVFPNPVRHTAKTMLALPEAADVRITVYDVLGRRVVVLTDERLEAGRHTLDLNARYLPSAIYLVRAAVGDAAVTQRVTVVR